jgi:hypothetical protein
MDIKIDTNTETETKTEIEIETETVSPSVTQSTAQSTTTTKDTNTYCSILSDQPKGVCKSCLQAYKTTSYTFRHDPIPCTTSGLYQVYNGCHPGKYCSSISHELMGRYGACIKDITSTQSKGTCTLVVDWQTHQACDAQQTRAMAAACTTYCLAE